MVPWHSYFNFFSKGSYSLICSSIATLLHQSGLCSGIIRKSNQSGQMRSEEPGKATLISLHPCELMHVLQGELSFWRQKNIHHNDKGRFFSAQMTLLFDFLVLSAAISATRRTKKEFPEESRCFTRIKMRHCAQFYGPLRFPRTWICRRFPTIDIIQGKEKWPALGFLGKKETSQNW